MCLSLHLAMVLLVSEVLKNQLHSDYLQAATVPNKEASAKRGEAREEHQKSRDVCIASKKLSLPLQKRLISSYDGK
jgi:hypothetical protein